MDAEIKTINCPYCAEAISPSAKKCRHCGEILDPQMRELQALKSQSHAPQVFMNAGGGAAVSAEARGPVKTFPHWLHILLSLVSGGLWIPVYFLMYVFRNRRFYY